MNEYLVCKGKTLPDCQDCNKYYSSHSLHYDHSMRQKVVNISCSFGGNKDFDENGNEI